MKQPSSDNAYFVVSHELIVLLQWLIEHEQESLKKIIARALPHGLEAALQATQSSQHQPLNQDELQQNVVDFFSLLETLMYETSNENEVNTILQRAKIPAIQHINANQCDKQAIAISIAKATQAAENHKENPKEVLCREFLRRWKPLKKQQLH